MDIADDALIVAAVSVLTGALLWAIKNLRIVTKSSRHRDETDEEEP